MNRGPTYRWFGLTGAAAFVAGVLMIAASSVWFASLRVGPAHLGISRGCASFTIYESPQWLTTGFNTSVDPIGPESPSLHWVLGASSASSTLGRLIGFTSINGFGVRSKGMHLVLWPWVLVTGAVSATFLYAARRAQRALGLCSKCGYSLEGLGNAAQCPECAAPRQ